MDDQLSNWTSDPSSPLFDYMFNVSFWRPVPYDPARPWREDDGMWYQLISLDACNDTGTATGPQNCQAGGQLGMWKSPALRGSKADWQKVGAVFTSNATVLDTGFLHKEFVTIDYIGMLEGDPAPAKGGASGTRLFLNNVGGNGGGDGCCSGTTSYFPVMQAAPGAPLTQVGPQGMVDWGAFTFADGSHGGVPPANATGIQLLWGMASRAFSMARTLGSEEADQVNKPGRRVLIGWIGPPDWQVQVVGQEGLGSMQSLPRELSLAPDKSLLQTFVPELQMLRRQHLVGPSVTVTGLQAEVHASFPSDCAMPKRPGGTCGLLLDNYGELLFDQQRELVTLNLTAANNTVIRAGPLPTVHSQMGYVVHLYIDHLVLELIVNNATAMTAYWSPPAATNNSLRLTARSGALEVWELASAHNNTDL